MFTNPTTAEEMRTKTNKLKKFWPNRNSATPFVFCDVIGTEKVTETEFISKTRVGQESKYNSIEADKIVRYYKHFYCRLNHSLMQVQIAKVLHMNYGISQQDIFALSPYQAQCKIEKKLQDNRLSLVKSSTVKSSEGTNTCEVCVNRYSKYKCSA